MNRREFLLSLAASPLLASCDAPQSGFSGQLLGANYQAGHKLRAGNLPAFSQSKHTKVAIIGAGVSGLSAGWMLQKHGITDYKIFELEAVAGGNARGGKNAVSAYPWGAHYLPVPNAEAQLLKAFLAEIGVITDNPESASPSYHERYLCFAPQERLYMQGLWQEGLVPSNGLSLAEKQEMQAFEALMQQFSHAIGRDGKPAFNIPLAESSKDETYTALDKISIADYLRQQGWHSKPLHWYVNYACRDDYGAHYSQISAWAGIHYFASRRGTAKNAEENQVLTWPEGNSWLTRHLAQMQSDAIQTQALVHSIATERHQAVIDVLDLSSQSTTRWQADQVIFASPLHVLPYVLKDMRADLIAAAKAVQHAPWLVANLTIQHPEYLDANLPTAWDNVIYHSNGLGYVLANHQNLERFRDKAVLTYYRSYAEMSHQAARKMLYEQPWQFLADAIVTDLSVAHPEIRQQIESLDVWRWGHAMRFPQTGFLSDAQRLLLNQPHERLHIAHTDAAGISIFEEAFAQGTSAAQRVLAAIGV